MAKFTYNTKSGEVFANDGTARLSKHLFNLFLLLASGEVVSTETILTTIYGEGYAKLGYKKSSASSLVSMLRKRLRPIGVEIENIYTWGYRLK